MAKATADKACWMDIQLAQPQRKNYEKATGLRGQVLSRWTTMHLDECARRDSELAKGFGACRREGFCRRSDGGDRIGFLSPLRVFRFAGHDAHGSATYITCGSSAGECLRP